MQRYYFPIIHKGQLQPDNAGEVFGSPDIARQYGAQIARDIGSDPEFDRGAGTVVLVLDAARAEIARHVVGIRVN
ncbi:hypothetical protein SAMN05216573_10764 [Bradyrhizobium sp. Rc3b]|uniref:DUF6894 family protein n=1 Tax=Bradyrhizobium sp. Rc3b TaxID=1855322 RepID=UPI0008E6331C|nr:hypothetical protein [Bradyrhizobium sp. Rc3b]SFN02387.1 hypothetical protein SAMN05216573_10764 [Bradyrhizobium sp. Rc3b]